LEAEARGLGTLVQMGDQVVVVTHDHWGELLDTAVTAQFYNANGVLLAEISGADFRNLLHYRDQSGNEMVEVVAANVISVTEREGVPAYLLQTADGTPVLPGDSGGGVWSDGQLVGNLWRNRATETVVMVGSEESSANQTVTDMSVMAAFASVTEKILPGELELTYEPKQEGQVPSSW